MGEHRDVHQIRTDRRQGVVLLAVVCLVALVVLTIAQASIHDWSVYSAVGSSIGGALVGTEWGMVLLGIFLGAGLALMVAYMYYLMSQYRNGGANQNMYGYTSDLESGKAKFLAAKDSEHERDYVARYGQKAYRMGSGNQMASMPQPLTPGHTSTLKIKALPEQDMPAPGRGWSLGRLLSFSWDPASKPQALVGQPDHAQPSRLSGAGLSSAQSTSSSIGPIHEPSLPPSTRTPTYTELANQISSPFGFLRAGSALPVAHDPHSLSETQSVPDAHHHQGEGGQAGTPRKGGGLLGHMYNRKLEQAQQMQAVKTKLVSKDAPVAESSGTGNPRIMVLRESGDVEVNVELGDHENMPDGSFMRTTMHRRRRTSSVSEAEEEAKDAARNSAGQKNTGAVPAKDSISRDGHAPEVVPADASHKKTTALGQSKKDSRSNIKAGDASADAAAGKPDSSAGSAKEKVKRPTSSPVFLSPATSLNSNSSGLSRHSSGGRADFDSLATTAAAVATAGATPAANCKPAGKPVLLSSAAVQKMDSSSKSGKKAAPVNSAKSVKAAKSGNHSRSNSVEWQDVELQSEGEDKASAHPRGGHAGSRKVPSHLAHAAARGGQGGSAIAAVGGAETETEDGMSEVETERGQQRQRAGLPEVPSSDVTNAGVLKVVALSELGREGQEVRLVVCINLEQVLPRPQAGLLSRMLRLADVPLVKGEDGLEPVYVVQPGGEYRIGVGLFQGPGGRRVQVQGASWLSITLPGAHPVTLPLDHDEDAVAAESETGEWSGNTTWVLSQDQAKAVATALEQQQEHGVVPLEVTIGLQCSGKASKKGRKHKSQETLLPCTLKLKIIPRGGEAQSLLDLIDIYSPPAELLSFWKTWNGSADDIQDCTVICAK